MWNILCDGQYPIPCQKMMSCSFSISGIVQCHEISMHELCTCAHPKFCKSVLSSIMSSPNMWYGDAPILIPTYAYPTPNNSRSALFFILPFSRGSTPGPLSHRVDLRKPLYKYMMIAPIFLTKVSQGVYVLSAKYNTQQHQPIEPIIGNSLNVIWLLLEPPQGRATLHQTTTDGWRARERSQNWGF